MKVVSESKSISGDITNTNNNNYWKIAHGQCKGYARIEHIKAECWILKCRHFQAHSIFEVISI